MTPEEFYKQKFLLPDETLDEVKVRQEFSFYSAMLFAKLYHDSECFANCFNEEHIIAFASQHSFDGVNSLDWDAYKADINLSE